MYDVIIIGGGPAGMAAAVYCARYKFRTLILAKELGGTAAYAPKVENYAGFKSVTGMELMQHFEEQVKYLGVEIKSEEVKAVTQKNEHFEVNGYSGRHIILATGTKTRKLGVPGEDQFHGKGVSYCAICDAAFFKEKVVGIVGGSDSAAKAALLLAEFAKKVMIIYRKEKIRCEPFLVDLIEKNTKIEVVTKSNVTKIKGAKFVQGVELDTGKELKLDGIFIEIGADPRTELAEQLGCRIKDWYIKVDDSMRTNVKNVYAAGDVTAGSDGIRQIATAVAEGVIAAHSAFEDCKGCKK